MKHDPKNIMGEAVDGPAALVAQWAHSLRHKAKRFCLKSYCDFKSKDPWRIGLRSSKIFALILLLFAVLPDNSGWPKFVVLLFSSPNEVGDSLAGIAGSLAFLWIIVTVLLQSAELRAQREELELTRQEFSKMAEAQADQVNLLRIQGEIFTNEQKQRMAIEAERDMNSFVERIAAEIKAARVPMVCVYVGKGQFDRNKMDTKRIFGGHFNDDQTDWDIIRISVQGCSGFLSFIKYYQKKEDAQLRLYWSGGHLPILGFVSELLSKYELLSRGDQIRLDSLALDEFSDAVEEVRSLGIVDLEV